VRFILLPGHRFDTVGVAPLIKDIEFGGLIADKAFDSNWIIEDMNKRKAKIVISQHQRRAQPLDIDKDIYKWRHLIENFFGKLKEFKRIAMRSDKTDQSFSAPRARAWSAASDRPPRRTSCAACGLRPCCERPGSPGPTGCRDPAPDD
jgi:transposase